MNTTRKQQPENSLNIMRDQKKQEKRKWMANIEEGGWA